MAWRFDGTDDDVRFNTGAMSGHGTSAATFAAAIVNRNAIGSWDGIITVSQNGTTTVQDDLLEFDDTNHLSTWPGAGTGISASTAITDTTNFVIVAMQYAPNGTPRFHWKIGASAWVHENGTGSIGSGRSAAWDSSDRIIVGTDPSGGDDTSADITVAGIFKGAPSDVTVETLTLTSYADWQAFGFSWLVPFNITGTLVDDSGGAGGEVSRTAGLGGSLVADPTGFFGGGAAATSFVPRRRSDSLLLVR